MSFENILNCVVSMLLTLAAPAAIGMGGAALVVRLTGRRQAKVDGRIYPINTRFGYSALEMKEYWSALQAEGRAAELRFLAADYVYTIVLGATMIGSLAWRLHHVPEWPFVLVVFLAVVSDCIEDALQRGQIRKYPFEQSGGMPEHIPVASFATQCKLVLYFLGFLMLACLACPLALPKALAMLLSFAPALAGMTGRIG
ncbi:MAG TPA: hypothetical protein VGH80_04740 [Xanthomonadaceae bacterium]